MTDLLDPTVDIIWADDGWREPFEAWETDPETGLEIAEDITTVTEIRAALKRRTGRGEDDAAVIEATLTGGTIVKTDAEAGLYEIRLPDDDDDLVAGAAVGGTWDLRIRFSREGGVEETIYLGVREIRAGFGTP